MVVVENRRVMGLLRKEGSTGLAFAAGAWRRRVDAAKGRRGRVRVARRCMGENERARESMQRAVSIRSGMRPGTEVVSERATDEG